MAPPIVLRSLSFHESWPRWDIVELGARLGYNDCTFQTEKGTMPRLRDLARRARAGGWFRRLRDLGMTVTVWTHELNEADPEWGAPAADNAKLWQGLRERYDEVLGRMLPETDHLVLTLVESAVPMTDRVLLPRLVEVVHERCRAHGARLVLRTFVHHPEQQAEVEAVISELPEDVILQTKAMPQDWHLRHINDPLLGRTGGREQWVEMDICGEYWREDWLASALDHALEPRFRHWTASGVSGMSLRVDRGWRPWERQATLIDRAQEANLWVLGLLAAGTAATADEAWQAFVQERFPSAPGTMTRALRGSGRVVEESLCVGRECFGNGRASIPAIEAMWGVEGFRFAQIRRGERAKAVARRFEDEEDRLLSGAFHQYFSVHRWWPEAKPFYHRLRRGDPEVIAQKEAAQSAAEGAALEALEAMREAGPHLPADACTWHLWHLRENLIHLRAMGAVILAWLEASRSVYAKPGAEQRDARARTEVHLGRLREILAEAEASEPLGLWWSGRHHLRHRLAFLDLAAYEPEFRRYFGMEA